MAEKNVVGAGSGGRITVGQAVASVTKEAAQLYSTAVQQVPGEAGVNGGPGNGGGPVDVGQQLEVKRVLVVGYFNVARIRGEVLDTVRGGKRVQVGTQPGKHMVNAIAKPKEMLWEHMEWENLVVIHAGFNDMSNRRNQNLGSQTEAGLGGLREVSEGVTVEICTIPDVRRQSLKTQRRAIDANLVIQEMSLRHEYG